ncbi:MAG: 6-phosphofructokinase [Candidatus Krumholzibacteriia bacterium]
MKRIGVLTGGGDAAGMNAAVRAAVRTAHARGLEVLGIRRGWRGLSEGDAEVLTPGSVGGIMHLGGTVLRTFRFPEFASSEGDETMRQALKELRLDGLVVIGGDGSFRGGEKLGREFGVPSVGVPATIDNDIPGTDMSIGFDTALNIAVDAVDKIRDTATSHGRIFVVEVMGREYGLLAVQVALTTGAEEALVPEIPYDIDEVCRRIDAGYDRGKKHAIIIVAEGAGKAPHISYEIKNRLNRDVRMAVLGHVQRGGSPTGFDRILATRLAYEATERLAAGEHGVMVGVQSNRVRTSPLARRTVRDAKRVQSAADLLRVLT